MGILNSHQRFFIPALTPAMYQIGMIFGVTLLSPTLGIRGLAWGVLIGSAFHLLLQLPLLFKQKAEYTPTLGLGSTEVREVARLMGPRLLGVAVVQLNFWINVRLASEMPEGSVTAVMIAFTLMLMPQAAIAQSIATAALPTFSAQVARGKLDEMRASLSSTLRGILLLSIPASLGLILLRTPLIRFLYQRGEFSSQSTRLVAWALLWYAAGLVGHALVEILARAFYSLHDTRTPVLIGVAAMTLNVLFSYGFAAVFRRLGWMPHGGLALANTLATGLEMLGLIWIMRKRLNGLNGREIGRVVLTALASGGVMTLVIIIWNLVAGNTANWILVLGGILSGLLVYAGGLWALKNKELRGLISAVRARIS